MTSIISTISLALLLAPPPTLQPQTDTDSAAQEPGGSTGSEYRARVTQVADLNDRMNQGEDVAHELTEALAGLAHHAPDLAHDPAAQELRALAMLNIARARMRAGMRDEAIAAIDEAIRTSMGQDLPADRFGPSLAALYAERRAALDQLGKATIEVDCHVPCSVFIDEHATSPRTEGLSLGTYRVWVEATDAALGSTSSESAVALTEAGQIATIEFGRPIATNSPGKLDGRPRERIMTPEAEAALMTLGVGAAMVGALLVGFNADHRPQLIAGSTLLGVGGAMLLTGTVTLAIDEVREGRDRGRRLSLVWTMKF